MNATICLTWMPPVLDLVFSYHDSDRPIRLLFDTFVTNLLQILYF